MRNFWKILIVLVLGSRAGVAQNLKTKVCVVGTSASAVSAGIQSARSGVKTLLVIDFDALKKQLTSENISNPYSLQTGIWAEVLANYLHVKKHAGPLPLTVTLQADSVAKTLKLLADTVKNLSTIPYSTPSSLKKSGKNWELKLKNGTKLKTYMLVDADGSVIPHLNLAAPTSIGVAIDQEDPILRTSVATLDSNRVLPLFQLVPEKANNIVIIPSNTGLNSQMHVGQAAGAVAAFCAFFDTNTDKLNVRLIQNELLSYKAGLIPFKDVHQSDSSFIAIQHLALSGLMHSKPNNTWSGDSLVNVSALQKEMKSLYSRSQIWFADHPIQTLNIQQAIELITYTATRGKELRNEIEQAWQTSLKFKSVFNEKRAISRIELTVLLDTYLNPFATQVDREGAFIN